MDRDIYHLTLLYLLKARELAISGQDHKAPMRLGLPREVARVMKRLPLVRLVELAQLNTVCFTLRTPTRFWKDLEGLEPHQAIPECLLIQFLNSTANSGHGDLTPPA